MSTSVNVKINVAYMAHRQTCIRNLFCHAFDWNTIPKYETYRQWL